MERQISWSTGQLGEICLFLKPVKGSISYTLILTFPSTCEGNVWNFRKFSSVKLLLLVSIHFAWHQVTILEEEREGGTWAPMAPPLDPPLGLLARKNRAL